MPADRFEIRVSLSKLLIGLAVTVIPISLAGLYSLSSSDRSLERTIGTHFKTMAQSTAGEVSQFIHDRISAVTMFAGSPAVVDAALAANRSAPAVNPVRIQKIEATWNGPAAEPLVKQILGSEASRRLRRFCAADPRVLRITVTDEKGHTIAATHKTLDYFQADESYWQAIYAQGRGAISVTDVLYDQVSKAHYIGVGAPVRDPDSNRFIGTLDALIDVSSLGPVMHRVEIGSTARIMLVKEDGTVILGPQVNLGMNIKSGEYATVRDALPDYQQLASAYVVGDVPGAARSVIGFADTGLRQGLWNLGWRVVVAQDTREAFAPIRASGRLLAFMSLVGLISVTLLAVYFSLHRRRPFEEIEALRSKGASA